MPSRERSENRQKTDRLDLVRVSSKARLSRVLAATEREDSLITQQICSVG